MPRRAERCEPHASSLASAQDARDDAPLVVLVEAASRDGEDDDLEPGIDALMLLRKQHAEVLRIVEKIRKAPTPARCRELAEKLADKLRQYTQVEEALLFPSIAVALNPKARRALGGEMQAAAKRRPASQRARRQEPTRLAQRAGGRDSGKTVSRRQRPRSG